MATAHNQEGSGNEKTVGEANDAVVDIAEPKDGSEHSGTPEPENPDAWKAYWRIFKYGGPYEYTIQTAAVAASIGSGAGIAIQTMLFGRFVTVTTDFTSGTLTPPKFRSESSKLALYFVYLGIARFVLAYIYNAGLTYTSHRLIRNIRHAYLQAALAQEVAYYDMGTIGSVAAQGTSNGRLAQAAVAEKLGLTIQGLSTFVSCFILAFVTQWKLTLIVLCIAPATIMVMAVTAVIQAGYETKIFSIHAKANSFAEGVLASARTVQAFEMRSRLVAKFDRYLEEAHGWGNKISPLLGVLFSAEYTIIFLGFGLAFWQGIRMLARGEIASSGDVFTVLLAVVMAALRITIIAPYSIDFTRGATAAARLFLLIDRKSAIDPFDETGAQPEDMEGDIRLENVTFAYPSRPGISVLEDFSLHIPVKKVTALVGQSGSGKSTIVGLIERWYNPGAGVIKLDGRPIQDLNLRWLRRHIRLVQQEPVLFQGTIFENIAHGLVGTPWENKSYNEKLVRVREAAKTAFAHDFISELPDGYDSEIGQRGGLLSGGQKQRIAIARSIVSQPKVLLLDEATSALDPHAEGIVQQALDRASEGRTTIVIAHKLATIRKADNIVVMSKGRIVEQGTHEGLIARDGTYARLVKIQDLTVAENSSESTDVESVADAAAEQDPADLMKTVTPYATTVRDRLAAQMERDNFDNHKRLGLFAVVWRLAKETPELLWAYIAVGVGILGSCAVIPAQSILMSRVMDVFTLEGEAMIRRGDFFAKMFIVLAAGCLVFYFIIGYGANIVAQTLSHKLRRQCFNDMLRQDLQFFDRPENSTGALTSKLDSNPQAVFELMGFNVALIFVILLNLLVCSVLGISHAWKLGLVVVFGGLPPFILSGWFKIRADSKLDRELSKRFSASASVASEAVLAIRTVSSLAIEDVVLSKYVAELDTAIHGTFVELMVLMLWFALTQSIEYFYHALGFWYGCYLLSFGNVDMYNFFVTFLAVFFAGEAVAQMFQYSTSITKGQNSGSYLFWLNELQPAISETPENRDNGPKSGGPIEFEQVRFSYPLRPDVPVLKGVDLEIKKGKFIAVVGASGCGKSTVISLLERFYDPAAGTIKIASDPLPSLNPVLYRRKVALVQQEPTLFQGSIRENIALGIDPSSLSQNSTPSKSDVSDDKIEAALRAANAWDFVSSLPDGMSTFAGPSGTQLSGGQRQRIAIARALVRDPEILLLDEATSALDSESEKIVQGALAEAAKAGGRITVAVAHRLSTVRDADAIHVFHGGRIAESGTHSELAALGGMYRKMCDAQNLE